MTREVRRWVFTAVEAEAHRIVMEGPVGIAIRTNARAKARKEMEDRRRVADSKFNMAAKARAKARNEMKDRHRVADVWNPYAKFQRLKINKDGKIGYVYGPPGPIIDERVESTQSTNVESTATSSTDNRGASIGNRGAEEAADRRVSISADVMYIEPRSCVYDRQNKA